jgi:hypothetical protein
VHKKTDKSEQYDIAQQIYDTYGKLGTLLEVNTTSTVRTKIQEALLTGDANKIQGALNEFENAVKENLKDSFARFKQTTTYLQHCMLSNMASEMKMI